MLKITIALLALMANPAMACELVSRDGTKLEIPDPMTVVFIDADGTKTSCGTFGVGTGIEARGLSCGESATGVMFSSPTTLDGPEDGPSFVVAMNTVFFEKCAPDETPTDLGLGN